MARLARSLLLIPLLAALLVGASSAQAARGKLFPPPHSPLSETKVVKAAKQHIRRMDEANRPTRNFVRFSSRKSSKLVAKLNDKRRQRNRFRAAYLDERLARYRNEQVNPVFRRYNERVEAARAEYRRDIRRINERKESRRKKRAAKARAVAEYRTALARAGEHRTNALRRANERIAATRRANFELYERIAARETKQIREFEARLRAALARLRDRLR